MMRKNWIFLLALTMLLPGGAVRGDEGRELLEKALAVNRRSSFVAEFILAVAGPVTILGATQRQTAKYYRFVADDGFVFKRLDLPADDITYIENREGKFGLGRNYRARLREVINLDLPECLAAEIPAKELEAATISVQDCRYNQIDCRELTVRVPDSPKLFRELTGMDSELYRQYGQPMMKNWPVVRTFRLERKNNFIRAREHRNARGKKVFAFELTGVDFDANLSEADFAVPEAADWEEFDSPHAFLRNLAASRSKGSFRVGNWFQSLAKPLGGGRQIISWLLTLFGVVLFGLVWWLRRRSGTSAK
ncbi:hypothetical protein [Victivallis sp. Marseille-Q1083]|uniref:hypothetical protein n=1 Tax=Victivallis sp. Marseille-Q1083 TaxID=2717288 RepID=UPI001588EFEA|nr:hypothetical protein [Victivallis sp. Marseille-Q1083]